MINKNMRSTQNKEDEQFLYLLLFENTSYLFPLKRSMLRASKKQIKNCPLLEYVLKLTTIICKSMTLKISEFYNCLNLTRAGPGLWHSVKSNRIFTSLSSKKQSTTIFFASWDFSFFPKWLSALRSMPIIVFW